MNNKRTLLSENCNDGKRHRNVVPLDSSKQSEVMLCDTSKKDSTYSSCNFANISHKNCFGANNWNKFVQLSHSNLFDTGNNKNKRGNNDNNFSMTRTRSSSTGNPVKLDISSSLNKIPGKKFQKTQNVSTKDKQESVLTKFIPVLEKSNIIDNTAKQTACIDKNFLSLVESNDLKESPKLTKQIAMDCEMVGVEIGVNNNMLARVSLVNSLGDCIYDKYVKPTEPVLDYRTHVSGIRPKDLENATDFNTVQKDVADILKGRILVGHALQNDLGVLFLTHPKRETRDTSKFQKFREGRVPALKKLAKIYLGVTIQEGEHSSVQDALAAMQLYRMFHKEWEASLWSKKCKNKQRNISRKNKSKFPAPHTAVDV